MPKCCGTDSERWQEVRRESYSFHRDGEALPNADAESGEPISSPARVKLMNQRLHQPRTRHAERMAKRDGRSEEHTSELQSLMRISYAVFCLKKKKNTATTSAALAPR